MYTLMSPKRRTAAIIPTLHRPNIKCASKSNVVQARIRPAPSSIWLPNRLPLAQTTASAPVRWTNPLSRVAHLCKISNRKTQLILEIKGRIPIKYSQHSRLRQLVAVNRTFSIKKWVVMAYLRTRRSSTVRRCSNWNSIRRWITILTSSNSKNKSSSRHNRGPKLTQLLSNKHF